MSVWGNGESHGARKVGGEVGKVNGEAAVGALDAVVIMCCHGAGLRRRRVEVKKSRGKQDKNKDKKAGTLSPLCFSSVHSIQQ